MPSCMSTKMLVQNYHGFFHISIFRQTTTFVTVLILDWEIEIELHFDPMQCRKHQLDATLQQITSSIQILKSRMQLTELLTLPGFCLFRISKLYPT